MKLRISTMIIDFEAGWLFVKTGKVGGTSVEIALSRLTSENSIITPNMPEEEELRRSLGYKMASGYQVPLRRYTLGQIIRRLIRGTRPKDTFWDHIGVEEIRDRIGVSAFDDLFKVSIVRNPFDEAVSRWRWYGERFGQDKVGSFEKFILNQPEILVSNSRRTSIAGKNAMDSMVRYEHMSKDFKEIQKRLSLDDKFLRRSQ